LWDNSNNVRILLIAQKVEFYDFFYSGMPHQQKKPFDFGADPRHYPDPGILTEFLPLWNTGNVVRILLTQLT